MTEHAPAPPISAPAPPVSAPGPASHQDLASDTSFSDNGLTFVRFEACEPVGDSVNIIFRSSLSNPALRNYIRQSVLMHTPFLTLVAASSDGPDVDTTHGSPGSDHSSVIDPGSPRDEN